MLEQFWSLASKAERVFLESTAVQLGFGQCEGFGCSAEDSPVAKLRRAAVIKSLLNKPSAPKKTRTNVGSSSSNTPLLDAENAEQAKWAARLEAIGKRAGQHAKLFSAEQASSELSASESARLRQLVLISGAPRTMAAHIRSFERWEHWAVQQGLELYPISIDKLLKYCLVLDQRECGPSVVPTFKTAVRWVATRLAIELPDLDDHRVKAIQDKIVADRAQTLKEAHPIPIAAIGALEDMVCNPADWDSTRLFIWWLLCMVFASLRFDDAIHVKPSELIMKDEGLFGIAWQTKVERKRAGTRFMVPRVGFHRDDWLQQGWDLFVKTDIDRDYWMHELNTRSTFLERHPTYSRTVQWLRCFAHQATMLSTVIPRTTRK